MNAPMLYWFIPRGAFHFFDWLLLGAFLFWLGWLALGILDPARGRRTSASVLAVLTLGLVVWWGYGNYQERKVWEARQAYFKAAWAHFHKRCESAHVTYYKAVPPQDGVFIMKPANTATSAQLKDQFWMGDPYDLPDEPGTEANGLLFRQKTLLPTGSPHANQRGGFDYVESPHPDKAGKYLRYKLWSPRGNVAGKPLYEMWQPMETDDRQSRYGYTWDDISTKEDRHYWVAGGRLRVVDLETGEVVAERVGYVIERYFGVSSGTFNPAPWRNARQCPIRISSFSGKREFISMALGTWNELQQQGSKE